jgi:hypothetical protein
MDLHVKRVAMNASAFVTFRNIGKMVGCFDLENAEYIHARIVPPELRPRNGHGR